LKVKEELKRERDLAQKYLDVAGVIMVALDKEGRVTLLNRKGCEVLECTLKEALGKNWFENFLPTRVRDKAWRAFQSLMEGKTESMEYYENPVLTLKGEERLIAWHNTVIRDSKGQIIGTLSSGKDITEQKKAEEALRESEEKFRAIATAAKDAIILTDDAGIVIYWNPAAERIFGYTKEEAAGKELHKLILPKRFHIGYKSGLANFKLTGEGVVVGRTFEGVAVRKDGTEIPVELSMSAFQMEDKWHAVTIIRDITERKKAEEQIKKARDDYLAITNLTGDIIVHVDKEGRWTFLNDQACKFWGKPRDELLGIKFADYLHPDDQEKTKAAIQEAVKTRKISRGFINRQKTPKGWRIVEWNGAPIFDEKGNYVGLQATGRDVTERKLLEEELKRYSEHLERLVEERTRKLREVERLAAIGETAAMIGHDLRNPLQANKPLSTRSI